MKLELNIEKTPRQGIGIFRCQQKGCAEKKSITLGTWFENSRLSIRNVMSICYSFALEDSYDRCIRETFDFKKVASATRTGEDTIAAWYKFCSEMVVGQFLEEEEERGQIGGPGEIVQMDESKFGSRKYNKGKKVEGFWVLGMIQDGSQDFRLIVCPNNCRSAAALLPIIQQHIAPGTTIRTDMWKAYGGLDSLPDMNYTHEQVNHSDPDRPFVSEAGVHTNRVESSWRPAKDWFRKWRGRHVASADANMWRLQKYVEYSVRQLQNNTWRLRKREQRRRKMQRS